MTSFRRFCTALLVLTFVTLWFCFPGFAQGPMDVNAEATATSAPAPPPEPSQPKTSASDIDDSLHVTLGAYFWAPGVHGTVGALGHNASVHVSGTDVLSDLQFSLMGGVEIQKKRFVAPIDFAWVNLADTKALPLNDAGQTEARVKLNESFFSPRVGIRFVNTEHWKIDALGGVRMWHLSPSITLRPSQNSYSKSANLVDGIGGASIQLDITPRAFIRVFGDAGAGSANLDYQAAGWLGIRATRMLGLMFGWRYMDLDFQKRSDSLYDVIQNGPVVGLTFNFGGKAAEPVSASCTVSPREMMPGETVNAHITPANFKPKHEIKYQWSGAGLKLSSTSDSVTINTSDVAPGTYNLTATATDPKEKKNNVASCSGSFTVNEPPKHPPVASCGASPTTVKVGELATLTVNANSPDGRPLTYSYSSNGGQISGSGSTANLDTATATPGSTITASATVTDDRGLSASCDASVAVLTPPVVVQEVSQIGECKFENPKKPWRVDNSCKAVLDEVALRLQREPDGKVYVVGYEEEEETIKAMQMGAQRAVNIKKYLTEGEGKAGIDQSRVVPVKGKLKSKSGKIYFIPQGATFTAEETETIDETAIKGQ